MHERLSLGVLSRTLMSGNAPVPALTGGLDGAILRLWIGVGSPGWNHRGSLTPARGCARRAKRALANVCSAPMIKGGHAGQTNRAINSQNFWP